MRNAFLVLTVFACGKDARQPTSGSAAPSFSEFPGLVITKQDVNLRGTSLGFSAEHLTTDRGGLVAALRKANVPPNVMVGFTPDASAAAVLAAVRAVRESGHIPTSIELFDTASKPRSTCLLVQEPDPAAKDGDHVRLSLELAPKHRMLGLSKIDEFQVFEPPYTHFSDSLRNQKASALFADRFDIELAAAPEVTGADLASAITDVCDAGFTDLNALALDELTSRYHPGARLTDLADPPR